MKEGEGMSNFICETNLLCKSYKHHKVLSNISLQLKPGHIYGLIGANGAGKTTLMKCLTGLSFITSGQITLFGETTEKGLQGARKRIGSMIENPALTPYLSAKDHLEYHRLMQGIPNKEVIQELLQTVGLHDTGNKPAKDFSLGMKQRLGLAIALMGNPEFLILDEPINGLDPAGIVEIRQLLKQLCEEQHMTILISSHNLPELYQTVTDYIIIHQGEIKEQLTMDELDGKCRHYLHLACDEPEKLVMVLENVAKVENFLVMPDQSVKLYDLHIEKSVLSKLLYENGVYVTEFSMKGDTLENYFLSVIGGKLND